MMNKTNINLDDELQKFPSAVQHELKQVIQKHGGYIPKQNVLELLKVLDIDIAHLMVQLLPLAAAFARTPVSGFNVGAVALGLSDMASDALAPGHLYFGANMEFRRETLSFSIHGEQSATNNAWLHGERGLQALAINAAPCGYCRQFLYELTTAQKLHILLRKKEDQTGGSYTQKVLTSYLPEPFGPQDLGLEGGLMQQQDSHGLILANEERVVQAALDAANGCYAPYTKAFAGVALLTNSEKIFVGRYAENAAYNPTLSPMASALAFMNMSLMPGAELDIQKAVLVEASSKKTSQKNSATDMLQAINSTAMLEYFQV